MSEMVERVAIAIRTSFATTGLAWEKLEPEIRERWIGYACAAIEAMREPTEEMLEAHDNPDDILGLERDPEASWRRMIDAALTEKPCE